MNFPDSYKVTDKDALFQTEISWVFQKAGVSPTDALFVSYAYKGPDYQDYFRQVKDVFAKANVSIIDITSGNAATLIANAKAIVIGGGDIATFVTKMDLLKTSTFNPYTAIRDRVLAGVPYIGWNEGSGVVSPKYFIPDTNATTTGIDGSPFQIVCHYTNSAQNRTTIFNYLKANPFISKLICQTEQLVYDGSSVRLEESGGGMIDSGTEPFPTVIRYKIVNGALQES